MDADRAGPPPLAPGVLFETHPQPMWVYDVETLRFVAVNDAALCRYGYSREEFLAMTVPDLRPPEDVPALVARLAKRLPTESDAGLWRHRTRDGTVLHVHVRSSAIVHGGRPARLVSVHDLTEVRRATEALLASQERYRALFHALHDPVLVYSLEPEGRAGRILDANEAALALLGWPRDELLRRTIADVLPPERTADLDGRLAEVGEHGRLLGEGALLDRSGRVIPVEFHASLAELDGRPTVVSVLRDLTWRRQVDEALRVSQEHLRLAQKMEAVGTLAGGMAHHFSNLLTIVQCSTGLVLDTLGEDHPGRAELERARSELERGGALLRQILVLGRRHLPHPRPVDLDALLVGARAMLKHLVGDPVSLELRLAAPRVGVVADPRQVEQAVVNLAMNARDAMPAGGVLTIETRPVDLAGPAAAGVGLPHGGYVELVVRDTGVGMTPDVRDRAFEPFFTTRPPGKGTGLGLSTVWAIVADAGGAITLETAPRAGASFRILLPRVEMAVVPEVPVVVQTAFPATILLAEDEAMLRSLAAGILRRAGYHVIEAGDGAEAIEASRAHAARIDLLLTDIVMPRVGGRELAEALAASRPETRVLFMSGYMGEPGDPGEALPIDLLEKPFAPEVLLARVRNALACGEDVRSPVVTPAP